MSEPGQTETPGEPQVEPEPEGALEVDLGGAKQKVVPVGVVAAERKRARESVETKYKGEIEGLKAKADKADKLEADLAQLRPYLEHLQQHPELMKKEETPEIAKIGDEEAERFARHYELYSAQGLDLARAKRIIADQRADTRRVATEAAQEAVRPLAATSATQMSRQNFVWAAQEAQKRGIDPNVVAQTWSQVPAELSQHPEVAQLLLRASIGDAVFTGKAQPGAPRVEPIFSESPGGQRQTYQISPLEQKIAQGAGIKESDWTKAAQAYQPDAVNSLED